MRVLIADDTAMTLVLLERTVKKFGFIPVTCSGGDSAWAVLQAPDAPQLAILDWMMPGKSGVEICRALREQQNGRYTYIIISTSKTEKGALIEALEAGADDFIPKPVDPQELRVRLRAGQRIIQSYEELRAVNRSLDEKRSELIHLTESLDWLVRERTRELRDALTAAKEATAAKSMFLANMSHEIRTPLNGIVSYTELLLSGELSEEQRGDLTTIKTCVYNLKRIINDVLDFSKIEAGKMLIDKAPFAIRTAVNEVVDILKLNAAENGQEIIIEICQNVPHQVVGDRLRFQQILTNLLGNAVKFTIPGGAIVLYIEPVLFTSESVELHVAVIDSGVGIPADRLQAIFESFTQADSSTTRKFGGSGLGLTICQKLLEMMGGEIWVQSREGVGSAFSFKLPLGLVHGAAEQLLPSDQEDIALPPGLRILLAEDNQINQAGIIRLLQQAGCSVRGAGTGREVLTHLAEMPFDIVLMDIQMPEMGGDEATRLIRTGGAPYANIPIVALTGNSLDGASDQYLRLGMNAFVAKPINRSELLAVIRRFTV